MSTSILEESGSGPGDAALGFHWAQLECWPVRQLLTMHGSSRDTGLAGGGDPGLQSEVKHAVPLLSKFQISHTKKPHINSLTE